MKQVRRAKMEAALGAVMVLALIAISVSSNTFLAKSAKESQPKAAPEFAKLDASTLPITKKIPIGGDADWLAIGFGSVWVTVAKNNELVRVDPVRNVVQARVAVDKEPCYGIGIGTDRRRALATQSRLGASPETGPISAVAPAVQRARIRPLLVTTTQRPSSATMNPCR